MSPRPLYNKLVDMLASEPGASLRNSNLDQYVHRSSNVCEFQPDDPQIAAMILSRLDSFEGSGSITALPILRFSKDDP